MHTFLYIQVAVGSYEWLSVLSFFLRYTYIYWHMCICDHAYTMCVCGGVLTGTREGLGFPGARVPGGCELPDGCWELSLDSHFAAPVNINVNISAFPFYSSLP